MPTRATFSATIAAAGISKVDPRNRPVSTNSLRKTFATLLDSAGVAAGVRSLLVRHSQTLTERTYTDHQVDVLREAVNRLPDLWPEGVKIFSISARKTVAEGGDGRYAVGVQASDRPMTTETAKSKASHPSPSMGDGLNTQSVKAPGGMSLVSSSFADRSPIPGRSAFQSGNGQGRTEKDFDLNVESEVALTLSVWLRARSAGNRSLADEEQHPSR